MDEIFISYKREEQATARLLAEALEGRGWNVWWDPDLRAGDNFDDAIEERIRSAKCVIVLWSARSTASTYVKNEAGLALDLGKLIPIAIDATELPLRFRRIHTILLQGWQGSALDSAFRELVANVELKVGPPLPALIRQERSKPERLVESAAIQGTMEPQGSHEDVLRLAEKGDFRAVYARLGISGPPYEESLVINDADKQIVKNLEAFSRCLPPSQFADLLNELVKISQRSGGGARLLYVVMSQGQRDLALRLLKLLAYNSQVV